MKNPAIELNRYIERLAVWLRDNKPSYIKHYDVNVSTYKSGEDSNTIRFTINLVTSNSELLKLEEAGMIAEDFED